MIDLENVKVYSTDKCVAIKLAELLGVRFNDSRDSYEGEIVGVAYTYDEPDEVAYFSDDSECHLVMKNEITVEQINRMHAEKFGKIESPEEKEAFDTIKEIDFDQPVIRSSIGENESIGFRLKSGSDDSEWKNGDKCMIRGERLVYIGESVEAGIHCVQELGTCLYRNAHISVIKKPESPKQKVERERLEAAYDLYLARLSISEDYTPYTYDEFLSEKNTKLGFLVIVDKTGYRKEQ